MSCFLHNYLTIVSYFTVQSQQSHIIKEDIVLKPGVHYNLGSVTLHMWALHWRT